MIIYAALVISVVFASGTFLLLQRVLIRVVVGMILVTNSAVLFIIAAGVTRGEVPTYPLVQAMALTALIIGFGVTALLLAMIYRLYVSHHTIDLEEIGDVEMRQAEARRPAYSRSTRSPWSCRRSC